MRHAEISEAAVVHRLMREAFLEYRDETPPSSALEETPQSILNDFKNGEKALISYINNEPSGMVRYKVKGKTLYFYRLSVRPQNRGNGIAKNILMILEKIASEEQLGLISCKVRMSAPKNIQLYQSAGYEIYDEEIVQKPNQIKIKVVTMKKALH